MDKTHFSNVCHALTQLWLFYRDKAQSDSEWKSYFEWADVALPLAFAVDNGYVTSVKKEGKDTIVEAWNVFCEMIGIDPEENHVDIFSAFAASSNPPLPS